MIFKIRTSKKTMSVFEEIAANTNYAPFILSKLSISLSIKSEKPLEDADFKTDTYGLELNRQLLRSGTVCINVLFLWQKSVTLKMMNIFKSI